MLEEIAGLINSLNDDEKIDLVVLMWIGRENFDFGEWKDVREEPAGTHNEHTARYLARTPLLADFLVDGLDRLGYSVSQPQAQAL